MMSSMQQQQQGHEEEESHGGGFSSGSSSIGGGAIGVRKGSWTEEEDILLRLCVEKFGEGNWRQVPRRAGLNRCRKSCRLRWLNYLRPNINRSRFAHDEVDLIIRLHKLLGNKWSLISRRLPGRTANDVKNYWNSHLRKPSSSASSPSPQNSAVQNKEVVTTSTAKPVHNNNNPSHEVIKPQPRTLKKSWTWSARRPVDSKEEKNVHEPRMETAEDWWKQFLMHDDDDDDMDSFFSNIWGNGFASGLSSSSSPDQSVPDPRVQQPPAEAGVVWKYSTAVESMTMTMEEMDPFCMVPDDFCLDYNFWNTVID